MPNRRLNYTRRRKIAKDQAVVRLSPGVDSKTPRRFQLDLRLPDGLPPEAPVFVEAFRNSPAARMRFAWGSVANLQPPEDLRLTEFTGPGKPPRFRVKVTDLNGSGASSGRRGVLLAARSDIRPIDPDEKPENRRGILPTRWDDNRGLPWKLEFDEGGSEGPCLVIDRTADPDEELPGTRWFRALVYPELLRRCLWRAAEDPDSAADPDHWASQWLGFPATSCGLTLQRPTEPAGKETETDWTVWIDEAVRHCAEDRQLVRELAPPDDPADR